MRAWVIILKRWWGLENFPTAQTTAFWKETNYTFQPFHVPLLLNPRAQNLRARWQKPRWTTIFIPHLMFTLNHTNYQSIVDPIWNGVPFAVLLQHFGLDICGFFVCNLALVAQILCPRMGAIAWIRGLLENLGYIKSRHAQLEPIQPHPPPSHPQFCVFRYFLKNVTLTQMISEHFFRPYSTTFQKQVRCPSQGWNQVDMKIEKCKNFTSCEV